ncbi:hypothetical protein BGZ54_005175, partial [Gamsiella multidivaricata]
QQMPQRAPSRSGRPDEWTMEEDVDTENERHAAAMEVQVEVEEAKHKEDIVRRKQSPGSQ